MYYAVIESDQESPAHFDIEAIADELYTFVDGFDFGWVAAHETEDEFWAAVERHYIA